MGQERSVINARGGWPGAAGPDPFLNITGRRPVVVAASMRVNETCRHKHNRRLFGATLVPQPQISWRKE